MPQANEVNQFTEATVQDLLANPHAYGLPTREEFMADPDKYRLPKDHLAIAIDKGSETLNKHVKNHIYQWQSGKTRILELAEKWIKNDGYDWDTVDIKPEIIDLGGRWCDILVKIVPLKSKDVGTKALTEAKECQVQVP